MTLAHVPAHATRVPRDGRSRSCRSSEYEPGTAFPGVIGRTTEESSPAWPRPLRAVPGSPNVLFIVLDDTGFGQLGCYGSPIATPNLDALAAGGLRYTNMHTTALCSPSRSCIITGRNHHANAHGGDHRAGHRLPGLQRQHPVRERVPVGDAAAARLQHLHGRQVAPDAVGARVRRPGRTTAGRSGAASSASTGSSAATPASGIPDLVYDNHQVEPPRTPERGLSPDRGPGRQGDRSSSPTPSRSPRTSRSTCTSAPARRTPRTMWPRSGPTGTPGSSTTAGTPTAERVFARQKELGVMPADAELSRHDPDVPDWESLSPDARRLAARMMEVYAGFLSHTDHHIGRLLDFLKETGELDNTLIMVVSDNGASAEGGPTGTTNELQFFNNAPETLEDSLAKIDELGGPTTFNHYPWGWTWAGNTPFRRWKRETYRGGASDPFLVHWPAGHHGARRDPRPVRAHHRHGPHRPGRARHRAARRDPGRDPVADPRRQLRPHLRRRRPPRPGTAPSTSRCSATARSTTTGGGRSARGRGPRSPRPASRSAPPITAETLTDLDAHHWELYHVAEDPAENHDLAERAPGQAHRDDRAVVRRGRQVQRAAPSTAAPCSG